MNNIELSVLISGIIFFAIINYYFCFYKEEQINNKSIEHNKIIPLYNKAKNQKHECGKNNARFDKECEKNSYEKYQIEQLMNSLEKLSDRTVINFVDDNNKIIKKVDC